MAENPIQLAGQGLILTKGEKRQMSESKEKGRERDRICYSVSIEDRRG